MFLLDGALRCPLLWWYSWIEAQYRSWGNKTVLSPLSNSQYWKDAIFILNLTPDLSGWLDFITSPERNPFFRLLRLLTKVDSVAPPRQIIQEAGIMNLWNPLSALLEQQQNTDYFLSSDSDMLWRIYILRFWLLNDKIVLSCIARISWLRNVTRSCGKTSVRLMSRGHGFVNIWCHPASSNYISHLPTWPLDSNRWRPAA